MAFASRWMARVAGWTMSSSKGWGGRSNTNVSILILSRPEAKPGPASALGSATTILHHNTHLSMSLKRRDFADRDVIPRGIWWFAGHVRRWRAPLVRQAWCG